MTEIFDEYGNYIYPIDVPLKEPNYATSASDSFLNNIWETIGTISWAYRNEYLSSGESYGCPFGY